MKVFTLALYCGLFLLFSVLNSHAQRNSEIAILPAYNPSSVQLKILSGGECLTKQTHLTANNSIVEVQAFTSKAYDEQELKVPMVHVDLVRKGMLVGKTHFNGQGDISPLLALAAEGDIFIFGVEKLLIKTNNNQYETFTSGRISFQYEFTKGNGLVLNR